MNVGASLSQTISIVSPPAKPLKPLFILLPNDKIVDLASNDKSSVELITNAEVDTSKEVADSLKLKNVSTDDEVLNGSSKAADNSSKIDTDMAVVVAEGVVPALVTKQISKKGVVRFVVKVEMIDPVKKVSNNNTANDRFLSSHLSSTKLSPPSGI